ncbi:PROTEIN RKD5 [Salix purpurea]|uniref:PROTEIN RKD5 n=1 Tax=Salix purpurea TaxID=77065 RepID=A0A9Q1AKH8_SALPP|nr:PROTEIN RKD5 [Salix purpurea]
MASSLIALLVFENNINKELVRSLHVYRFKDGKEKEVEREFVFSVDGPYVEMKAGPMLRLRRFQVLELFEGQVIGLWRCIFAFHVNNPPHLSHSSFLLSVSRNPKLKSIPTLAKDIHFILKLSCRTDNEEPSGFSSKGIREVDRDNCHHSKKILPALDQDLNCLPYSVSPSELSKSKRIELCAAGVMEKKKKRAASEDIARIALEDVVKHFGQPIVEASRNLKVGLTVLKRKCRELGIPRWPHRKIKSLDSLIRSLQEEAERHEQDKEDTTMAVAKRRRMLESEKETIEKKPFMEIQSETKRFRQDVFKRRHRARALGNQGL